ncbi:uncharacterized protein LOC142108453 [Mixophyes fleayi]|uniref:uncharacterized protein LOC142108453 n=1 Tax=Mixophyes fleayi TaxID=3061075 RepID=UPI003F4DB5AE
MPCPKRTTSRPARLRSLSPAGSARHIAPVQSSLVPLNLSSRPAALLAAPSTSSARPSSERRPRSSSGLRGRAAASRLAAGSRMRRTRAPSRPAAAASVSSAGGGRGEAADSHYPHEPAGILMRQADRLHELSTASLVGSSPSPYVSAHRDTSFIQCPITPPVSARGMPSLSHNPPALHQLHFPPSPFLPHSGRGSAWGSQDVSDSRSTRGGYSQPPTPGGPAKQVSRERGFTGASPSDRVTTHTFPDRVLPVRHSMTRFSLSPPGRGLWPVHREFVRDTSPSGPVGVHSPGGDGVIFDYHHVSLSQFPLRHPPHHDTAHSGSHRVGFPRYSSPSTSRREDVGGFPSSAPYSAPTHEYSGESLGSARRRLDYLPRPQLTVPISISEPAHRGSTVDPGGSAGLESREQRASRDGDEFASGTSGGLVVPAGEAVSSAGAGNPAISDHQAGIIGLVEQAVAPSTLKTYQSAWRRWSLYSGQKDQSEAGQRDAILAYMWDRYSSGESRAAMASTLAGISFMAKLQGLPDVTKGFMISKALKGWGRTRPAHVDARLPITTDILDKLIGNLILVAVDDYERLLFSTAFSMAFFGAFRVSELVARSRGHQESGLRADYVIFCEGAVSCKLLRSKTDQCGRGSWVQLHKQSNRNICPVTLVSQLMNRRPRACSFLCHYDGMPLTKYQFGAILKQTLQSLNLDSAMYGTHSFRIGAATSAAMAGSSTEAIKAIGRWKSTAYKSYVRIDSVDV